MPYRAAAAAACAMILASAGASAEPPTPPNSSWGKAGVSYDDYRADAVECARGAAATDVSDTEAAQTLVIASRELDRIADTLSMDVASVSTTGNNLEISSVGNPGAYQRAMEKYQPRKQFKAVEKVLYQNLEQCLTSRGYVRFQLTQGQGKQLRKLKPASMERRQFLYRLASDPAVLQRQKVE